MNKLISIIVPVYNTEKYLDRCLSSLVNQTYKNIEILIINDGSPDNSQKIIDKYTKKNKNIRSFVRCNSGISSTRNYGIDNAKGDYIIFIDSDDYVDNNYCEYLYNILTKNKCDIACCDYCYNDEIISLKENLTIINKEQILDSFLNDVLIKTSVWNKIYSRKIINSIRFNNFKMAEDVLFNTKVLAGAKRIVCSNLKKYHYNTLNTSITRSKINIDKVRDCCNAHDLQYELVNEIDKDLLCKIIINKFNSLYVFYLDIDKNTSKEVKQFIKKEIINVKKIYKKYINKKHYSKKIMLKINLLILFFNLYNKIYHLLKK